MAPRKNGVLLSEKIPLLLSLPTVPEYLPSRTTRHSRIKRRSSKTATGLWMFFLLLSIYLLIRSALNFKDKNTHSPFSSDSNLCTTPACIHASSAILYNLSPDYKSRNPCNDFEDLVCGGWRDRHDIRPDQGEASTVTIMTEKSQTLLKHVLEAEYPHESIHSYFSPAHLEHLHQSVDQKNFEKLKAAYDACLDEDTIKEAGIAPLLDILHDIPYMFPAGPLFEKISGDDARISNTILYLARLGVSNAPVFLTTSADQQDPDTVIVTVSPPDSVGLLAKENYKDDKILAKYENVIEQVISAVYSEDIFEKDVFHGVVEFERKLAAASPDFIDREDVTKYYNPMSPAEANALTPQINLSSIITELSPAGFEAERIVVTSPKYMKDLQTTILETPESVLAIYFVWKVIQEFAPYIEAGALKYFKRFHNEVQGKDPESTTEPWRTCVNHVDKSLGWILSRFFVEKAFSAKAKDLGNQIVSDIKASFIEKLKVNEWLEKEVIELAIAKVHNIVPKIGYPTESPNIMDPPSLQKYYESVNISSKLFNNVLEGNKFAVAQMWAALGEPVDRGEWGLTASAVNAYYSPWGNEIVFPAGIMQFPGFDVNVPEYLNYGAFGSVSGHELSHAFDSTGRHYDQNGNYTDWWTPKTVESFEERAECFVKQYQKFSIEGPDGKPLHVDGRFTLGQNIADAGGVSASFAAWKKRAAEKPNQDLPGLDFFTQEQLFFVIYGNWWCGKSTKEMAINKLYVDDHSPKWARILGTTANSREFRQAFSCEKEVTCELW